MADFDLVVRGGNVADGTGAAIREADVAVKDGKIAAVGKVSGIERWLGVVAAHEAETLMSGQPKGWPL